MFSSADVKFRVMLANSVATELIFYYDASGSSCVFVFRVACRPDWSQLKVEAGAEDTADIRGLATKVCVDASLRLCKI